DELRLDAQDPPGVGVHPGGGTTVVQEPLGGGGPGDGAPPGGQRSRSSHSSSIRHALNAIRTAPAHTRQRKDRTPNGRGELGYARPESQVTMRSSASWILAISTYSSLVCASIGSPGP